MKPEILHDALSFLDEELVAPVEKLRRKKSNWLHIGALAACLAVICALGIYGAVKGASPEIDKSNIVPELAPEAELVDQEEQHSLRNETIRPSVDTPSVDMVDDRGQLIMETVLVEVVQLGDSDFFAKVLTGDRNFAEGTQLTVLLTENSYFVEGSQVEPIASAGAFFKEGSVLVVNYGSSEGENTIYAETISFGE